MRQIARHVAMDESYNAVIDKERVEEFLGAPIFSHDEYQGNEYTGVVTGLAWTSVGGEILFVESSLSNGKGHMTMTGNLGEVMKESATIALEYIKSHAETFGIDPNIFDQKNIHVHVPAGAVPKDGPSAGITMVTSLVSSLTGRKVKPAIAMSSSMFEKVSLSSATQLSFNL